MDAAAPRIAADDFSAVVRQLYRLFKTASIHLMNNQAVLQTMERSAALFNRLRDVGIDEVSVLFLHDTVFVNGTLLKASRDVYEAALELSSLLGRAGVNQISVATAVTVDDLAPAVEYISDRLRGDSGPRNRETPPAIDAFAMRRIDPSLLDDAHVLRMTAEDRVGRTYASTLVVMRFLYENLKAGRYTVSRQIKRLAQQLVLLAESDCDAFLAVTRMRAVRDDEAGRAVNAAILAILAGRQITDDVRALGRIALSTLLADAGRPRAAGMGTSRSTTLGVIPILSEAQRARMPAATALSLAAIGRLHEEALHRTVVGYEAQWLMNQGATADAYDAEFAPRLESALVATARRFNDALTFDAHRQRRLTPDEAISWMRRSAGSPEDRLCTDLLLQALGLTPTGTVVRLASGCVGVVVTNSDRPGLYGLPTILVYGDSTGARVDPVVLDLAHPDANVVRFGGIAEILPDAVAPDDLPQPESAPPPPPRPAPTPRRAARALAPLRSRAMHQPPPDDLDDDIIVEFEGGSPEAYTPVHVASVSEETPPTALGARAESGGVDIELLDDESLEEVEATAAAPPRPSAPPPLPAAGPPIWVEPSEPVRARTLMLVPAESGSAATEEETLDSAPGAGDDQLGSATTGDTAGAHAAAMLAGGPAYLHSVAAPVSGGSPESMDETTRTDPAAEAPALQTSARDVNVRQPSWLTPMELATVVEEASADVERNATSQELAVIPSIPPDDPSGSADASPAAPSREQATADLDELLAAYFGDELERVPSGGVGAAEHHLGGAGAPMFDPAMTGPLPAADSDLPSVGETLLEEHFPGARPLHPPIEPARAPEAVTEPALESARAFRSFGSDAPRDALARAASAHGRHPEDSPASPRVNPEAPPRTEPPRAGSVSAASPPADPRLAALLSAYLLDEVATTPSLPPRRDASGPRRAVRPASAPTPAASGARTRPTSGASASKDDLLAAYLADAGGTRARPPGAAASPAQDRTASDGSPRARTTSGAHAAARAQGARQGDTNRPKRPALAGAAVERVSGLVEDDLARSGVYRPVRRPDSGPVASPGASGRTNTAPLAGATPAAGPSSAHASFPRGTPPQPAIAHPIDAGTAPLDGAASDRWTPMDTSSPSAHAEAGSARLEPVPSDAIPAWARFEDDSALEPSAGTSHEVQVASDDRAPGLSLEHDDTPVQHLELQARDDIWSAPAVHPPERAPAADAPASGPAPDERHAPIAPPSTRADLPGPEGALSDPFGVPLAELGAPASSPDVAALDLIHGATLFGLPGSHAPGAAGPATVEVSPAHSDALLRGFTPNSDPFADLLDDEPPPRRMVPAPEPEPMTRDTIELRSSSASSFIEQARRAQAARDSATPAGVPGTDRQTTPQSGVDTVEVPQAHADRVLRDYLVRSPGAARPDEPARAEIPPARGPATTAEATSPSTEATREVAANSAAELLKRYLRDAGGS